MATITTHNGSDVCQAHNRREEKVVTKEPHINPRGEHLTFIDIPLRQAYDIIFGEAQDEYNSKQKRADRKIESYYDKIKNSKQKHLAYEMIVQVGSADEPIDEEIAKEILIEYLKDWQERNSNLQLVGAYLHNDETTPHMHLDYIPVCEMGRGMRLQNSLDKAFRNQGFEKVGKLTPQIQWQQRENEVLENICQERGISVEHPDRGKGKEHLNTETYKAKKQLEQVQAKKNEVTYSFQEFERVSFEKMDLINQELRKIKNEKQAREKDLEQTPNVKLLQTFLDYANKIIERYAPQKIKEYFKAFQEAPGTYQRTLELGIKGELGLLTKEDEGELEQIAEKERNRTRNRSRGIGR